jgi:hypothetical protein
MSRLGQPAERGVRSWATRSAGVVGLFNATLYLAVVIGQAEGGYVSEGSWFIAMVAAGLLAWFADRRAPPRDRRTTFVAMGLFFAIGVLSTLIFALFYLGAVVLCLIGLAPVIDGAPAR